MSYMKQLERVIEKHRQAETVHREKRQQAEVKLRNIRLQQAVEAARCPPFYDTCIIDGVKCPDYVDGECKRVMEDEA